MFTKKFTCIVSCVLLGSLAIAADSSTAPRTLLPDPGVVSFTFRQQFSKDVPGTLDLIQSMGISNIEFSNLFGLTASEMRALLDERDMRCTSLGVGYHTLMEQTDQVIADAHALGARFVRVAWIPHEGPFTIDNARQAVADFNRVGGKLTQNGLHFCYHNHGFEFQPHENGTLFDYIVRQTDPEHVSFQIDTFWVAYPGADPVELIKRYPDRFRLAHLKDLKKGVVGDHSGRSSSSDNDVVLGTGQVDFHAFLKAAQDSSIVYYYIEDETDAVVTRVPQSRAFITSLTTEH